MSVLVIKHLALADLGRFILNDFHLRLEEVSARIDRYHFDTVYLTSNRLA